MARSQVVGLWKVGVLAHQWSKGSGPHSCHTAPKRCRNLLFKRACPPLCHFLVSVCSGHRDSVGVGAGGIGREQQVMHKRFACASVLSPAIFCPLSIISIPGAVQLDLYLPRKQHRAFAKFWSMCWCNPLALLRDLQAYANYPLSLPLPHLWAAADFFVGTQVING